MKTIQISAQNNTPVRLSLDPRDVIATSEVNGMAVKSLRGSVWVTLEDGGADHILNQGESLPITTGRRVVIEALTHSEIGFSKPEGRFSPLKGITPTRYAEDCWVCI